MNSRQLKTVQLSKLKAKVSEIDIYLNAVAKRMEERDFSTHDELYQATFHAQEKIQRLWHVIDRL